MRSNKYSTAKEKMLNSKYAILIALFNLWLTVKLLQPPLAILASQKKNSRSLWSKQFDPLTLLLPPRPLTFFLEKISMKMSACWHFQLPTHSALILSSLHQVHFDMVWIDMGDTTKPHQVVLPTFTKLAQGCVLATLKIERLCFHFQDRFEIRGCNTSRGPSCAELLLY